MRNLFKFALVLGVFLSSIAFGQDLKKMKNDPIFVDYLKQELKVINRVQIDDSEAILSIIKDEKISKEEEGVLAKYFGFVKYEEYFDFVKSQNQKLLILNKNYNLKNIDRNELIELVLDTPEIEPILFPNEPPMQEEGCHATCNRTGRNCRIITTSFAVVAHAGCATADAILIGFVCHAAVTVGAVAQLDECNNQQSACNSNCKD